MNESTWQAWREARLASLLAADSWLSLVGLYWLEPGRHRVGAGPDVALEIPGLPTLWGELSVQPDGVFWQEVGSVAPVPLHTDQQAQPTVLSYQHLRLFIIEREGRYALRVKDLHWAEQRPFAGLHYFAYDPGWQISARWQALPTPVTLEVPTQSGDLKVVSVSHQAEFDYQGRTVALLPLDIGAESVFFVFRDRTSGKDSYGGGRFLQAPLPEDGRLTLDFNRAYNPPCAFTPFAACPLPPPENWLSFAVAAGEKKYSVPHSHA